MLFILPFYDVRLWPIKKKHQAQKKKCVFLYVMPSVNLSGKSNFVTMCTAWMPEHKCVFGHMQYIFAFMCFNYSTVFWGSVSLKRSAQLLTIKVCKSTCILLEVACKIQFHWNAVMLQFLINICTGLPDFSGTVLCIQWTDRTRNQIQKTLD